MLGQIEERWKCDVCPSENFDHRELQRKSWPNWPNKAISYKGWKKTQSSFRMKIWELETMQEFQVSSKR